MDLETQDQEQRKLRELLAWKRHEQPPPGFFVTFSSGVLAELESTPDIQMTWWERLQARIAGPAIACSYGAALGAALVVGIGLSEPEENAPLQAATFSRAASPWVEANNSRIPNLEIRDYPGLFGPAETSSSKPVIASGPVSFLMEESPAMAEKASFQFR